MSKLHSLIVESKWYKKYPAVSWSLVGFVSGCAMSSVFYFLFFPTSAALIKPLRESSLNGSAQYKFIDPLLGVSGTGATTAPEYSPLESLLRTYISDQIEQGNLSSASVIVSDINQAQGFVINPDENYSPASLLKVPTMIAYYKLAERDTSLLEQPILYSGGVDFNLQEHYQSPVQLEKGRTYSVEELIEHMIKYSDNNAAELLINHLNMTNQDGTFDTLFKDMGINQIDLGNDFISIRAYALFFRILYNSTYLSRDMSEKALALLSQTDFSKGIEGGVPNNIEVSQKFGEFTQESTSGTLVKRELHNCGIVYYPGHPYLLCIMTKGKDFAPLEGVLSEISRKVFIFMEQKYSFAPSSGVKK